MEGTKRNTRERDEVTIDLTELFMALWRKVHIIVLAGIFVGLLALVGTKLFVTPMYTSTTKFYVSSQTDQNTSVTYTDLQTSTQLTKDYAELVKSRPVLEEVISVLDLDMKPQALASKITVTTPADTRVMSISVVDADPKQAKDIADAAREAVSVQIKEIMNVDSVKPVEKANLPEGPSSPNVMRNAMIGGILGVLLAAGIIVLIFLLDDTIKTPEDVENYLGLNVLASIPIYEGTGAKNKKRVKGLSARSFQKKSGKRI
ncbi:protein-tyrosine kinase [Drancourtella sp. An177]|nr:protein-tyrosine kinase [Drancourtella sp. An177]